MVLNTNKSDDEKAKDLLIGKEVKLSYFLSKTTNVKMGTHTQFNMSYSGFDINAEPFRSTTDTTIISEVGDIIIFDGECYTVLSVMSGMDKNIIVFLIVPMNNSFG